MYQPQRHITFHKMHGLGNDFVVFDARVEAAPPQPLIRALADRHRAVGFDQLAVLESDPDASGRLTFYNADGSISGACGNATRCIARHLIDESGSRSVTLRTDRGLLDCEDAGNGQTRVNMGPPDLSWDAVPLAEEMDTLELPISGAPTATGMGNPHCTFFVENADAVDLAAFGPMHECHPLFPERTNVQVVHVLAPNNLRVRVWERGVGVTHASGSSSCAVAVAAARRGLTDRRVTIQLDGGALEVEWTPNGVVMTGPTRHVYTGVLTAEFLSAL